MCGIFGTSFENLSQRTVLKQLLNAIEALEYRGYDSAGIATQCGDKSEIVVCKCAGRVQTLRDKVNRTLLTRDTTNNQLDQKTADCILERGVGIAHTRWATHGPATDTNAHPHTSGGPLNQFAVVHNGILTNHSDLRDFLIQQGYQFKSDTDTEVIAVLCTHVYNLETRSKNEIDLSKLVYKVTTYLEGTYALLIVSDIYPNQLVATKRGSPLIVGLNGIDKLHATLSSTRLSTHNTQKESTTDVEKSFNKKSFNVKNLPNWNGHECSDLIIIDEAHNLED